MNKNTNIMISITLGLLVFVALFVSPIGLGVLDSMFPEPNPNTIDDIQALALPLMFLGLPFIAIGTIWGIYSLLKAAGTSLAEGKSEESLVLFVQEDRRWIDKDEGERPWISVQSENEGSMYLRNRWLKELTEYHTYAPIILGIQRIVALLVIMLLVEVVVNMYALGMTTGDAVRYTMSGRKAPVEEIVKHGHYGSVYVTRKVIK